MVSLRTLTALSVLTPLALASQASNGLNYAISALKSTNYGTGLGSTCACGLLDLVLGPQKVLFPNSTAYTAQATHYYSTRMDLSPKCVFVPASANDVATGVVILDVCKSQFAIRSAGHMSILGAANTDGGVLVALSSFANVTLSADKSTVDVGPAANWYQVNEVLYPAGLMAIGGRLKTIGVGGLTLGGGIHYFTAKYGFAMDNVAAYEVVIASGEVVIANATSNPDLFWALKGGGNNFGIVTKMTLLTHPAPQISSSLLIYGPTTGQQFVSAIADFATYQTELENGLETGGIFVIDYAASTGMSPMLMGVQISDELQPAIFENFTSIPSEIAVYNITNLADWGAEFDTPYQQARWMYGMHSMVVDNSSMQEMYSIYEDAVTEMDSINGFTVTLTYQPLPSTAFAVSANNGVGNTWAHPDNQNYVFWLLSTSWADAADDETVMTWAETTREKMHANNIAKGTGLELLYMNDSADDQDPIGSFPNASISRLQSIRQEYDPNFVFTNLVTGGFKLPN